MEFLAKFAGIDPLKFRRQMRDTFIQKYGSYLSMSEDERRIMDLKEENDFYRQQKESELQRKEQEQARMELESQFKTIQEAHGISDERRSQIESDLVAYNKAQGVNSAITPEMLLQTHNEYVAQDRSIAALEQVSKGMSQDDDKFWTVVSLVRGNPRMTDDELSNQVTRLFGNDVQKAAKNLEKHKPKKEQPKSQEYKPKVFSNGSVDFF